MATLAEWLEQGEAICEAGPKGPFSFEMETNDPDKQLPGFDTIPMPPSELPPTEQYVLWCCDNMPKALGIIRELIERGM